MKKYLLIILLAIVPLTCGATLYIQPILGINQYLYPPQLMGNEIPNTYTDDFNYLSYASSTVNNSNGTLSTVNDVNFLLPVPTPQDVFCTLSVFGNIATPYFYSTNPSIGTVDQNGVTTYVSDGTAYINIRVNTRTYGVPCVFQHLSEGTSTQFSSVVSTSTGGTILASSTAVINGLTASTSTYSLYSSANDTTHTYVRNSNLYGGKIATSTLTSIPAYISTTGKQFLGALVAPDTMIFAQHASPAPGSVIYFVGTDNTTYTSTVISAMRVGTTDIRVAKITVVNAAITPAEVMGQGAIGYPLSYALQSGSRITGTLLNYQNLPAFFSNQYREFRIGISSNFVRQERFYLVDPKYFPAYSTWNPWYRLPVSGDSGHASFYYVNGKMVLLGNFYYAVGPSNTNDSIDDINAAMTTLGSAYQLTVTDLSNFPTY